MQHRTYRRSYFFNPIFFLTRFSGKTSAGFTFMDYQHLYNELNCSKRIIKKVIRYQQAALSEHSCQSIFYWHAENADNSLPINLFKKMMLRDDDNRQVLPYYYFTQVLWYNLIKHQYPVLVVINRYSQRKLDTIYLPFLYSVESQTWKLQHSYNSSLQQAYFVIEGEMRYTKKILIESREEYKNRFTQTGLNLIIMANMAQHPQYSGSKLYSVKNNPFNELKLNAEEEKIAYNEKQSLMRMKDIALQKGCCQENPSLFFIKHIYCDILNNKIEDILYQNTINLLFLENSFFSKDYYGINQFQL